LILGLQSRSADRTVAPANAAAGWLAAAGREIGDKLARRVRRIAKGRSLSVDRVHQLRVLCRRVQAALDLANQHEIPAEVIESLDRVRRAAGHVRDADVLAELVSHEPARSSASVGAEAVGQRADAAGKKARRELRRVTDAERKHIDKLGGLLAEGLGSLNAGTPDTRWQTQLGHMVYAAETIGKGELRQVDQLHQLRIALKRVRYGVELCEPALGGVGADVSKGLASLQQALGQLNDCAMVVKHAQKLLDKAVEKAASPRERSTEDRDTIAGLRALIAARRTSIREQAKLARVSWASQGRAALTQLRERLESDDTISASDLDVPPPLAFPATHAERTTARATLNERRAESSAAQRIGAIDIGTNSMRLIIAEAHPDGSYRVLDDEKELTRLGAGLDASGKLSAKSIDHAVATLASMVRIASGFGVKMLRAVATSAVREASNGADFCRLAQQRTGLSVEIISAEEEALLAYRSVAGAFDLSGMTVSVVDIGGGSTEVITASAGLIERVELLPIGAVKLTERFGGAKAAAGRRYDELRRYLKRYVRARIAIGQIQPQIIIGTGGTLTTLAQLSMARQSTPRENSPAPTGAVRGYEVKRSELKSILDDLRSMDLAKRSRVAGLSADRADIIVPALSVLHTLCKRTGVKRVRVHDGGIRDGLLLTMAAELYPQDEVARAQRVLTQAGDAMASVRRFARSCRCDEPHSEHVAMLALRIFDQLRSMTPLASMLNDEARRLLEASSLLLDVGYIVNYDRHHVHSYNLILHSDLPGWERRQVRLIAAIARYHRGGEPKDRHAQLKGLTEGERTLIAQLSAIVRIAVGLDRTHTQSVTDVRLAPAGSVMRVLVDAQSDPAVDLWGASRKSAMFAKVFQVEPRFAWSGAAGVTVRTRALKRAGSGLSSPRSEPARASG